MLNRSLGAVQGVIRQGFTPKEPKNWKGNHNISQTQQRAMVRMTAQGDDNVRTIQAELKLPIGTRRVQQILRALPYLKYKNDNGTTYDPYLWVYA